MLTIRDEQLAVFRRRRRQQFEARMSEHFAHAFPEDFASSGGEEGARQLIRRVAASAASLGITTETGISLFLELFLVYGPELELAPYRAWALRMLANTRLPEELRLILIQNRLSNLTQGRRMVRFEPS